MSAKYPNSKRKTDKAKAHERAKVEHPFRVITRWVGYQAQLDADKQPQHPGTYQDGDGLRLVVELAGRKSLLLGFQLNGKLREMGLVAILKPV